jgi:phosphoglycolate phosphatase
MVADLSALRGAVILFDLDGTLVDTAPDLIGSLNAVLAEQGLPAQSREDAGHLVGRGARALIERGFAAAGQPLDDDLAVTLTGRFIEIYRTRIAEESRPYPGCVEALKALRAAGARLAVCTNKPTGLSNLLLDALELTPLFEAIVGADSAPAPKPDRRHVLAAMNAAGGYPSRTLFVGDSAIDVAAAKAAGTPIVAVSFGYSDIAPEALGADILIDRYADLPAACVRLLAACSA